MPAVSQEITTSHRVGGVEGEVSSAHLVGGVSQGMTGRHSLIGPVSGEVTTSHVVMAGLVGQGVTSGHEIGGPVPVAAGVTASHALLEAATLPLSVSVVVGGKDDPVPIDPESVLITGDRDSYCWSLTLTLGDLEDWQRCAPGSEAEVTVNGQTWRFLLESRDRNRSLGSVDYTASGRSPTILLDSPLAAPVTKTWGKTTAREAAYELCEAAGVSLTWEVCNWTIQSGRLVADEQSPVEILSALAAACGGVLQSSPAGDLRVIYAYPVPAPEMATATPVVRLSDIDNVFVQSESYEHREGYDAVVVTDAAAGDSDAAIQVAVDAERTGKSSFSPGDAIYLRVTASRPYTLRATSGILSLLEEGVEETPEAEVIEFPQEETAGAGSQVAAVEDWEWYGANPGEIVADGAGGLKLAAGAGFGIASVAYRTRYDLWLYTPENLGDQFSSLVLAEEITS